MLRRIFLSIVLLILAMSASGEHLWVSSAVAQAQPESPVATPPPGLYAILSQPGPLWLVGYDLSGQNLHGANLWRANLRTANLRGANLTQAILMGAELPEADLSDAILDHADLQVADLSDAILHGTSLRETNLVNAQLEHADLEGADLSGADLTGAALTGAALHGVIYDEHTTWPSGFDPAAAEATMVESAHESAATHSEAATASGGAYSWLEIVGLITVGVFIGVALVGALIAWLWFLTWATARWDWDGDQEDEAGEDEEITA